MKQMILIGDSGHAKVIEDCIHSLSGYEIIAKLDDRYVETNIVESITKGPISIIKDLLSEDSRIIISIGANKVRENLVDRLNLSLEYFTPIIHSTAIVSESAKIGRGTVIMPGVVVNAGAIIGDHCIINTNSIVEHDCVVGDFAHISPGAVLTGGVTVGEGTQIGAGATVIPGIEIGEWTIVGAGATVISNIDSHVTVVGTPAKVVKREGN